MIKSNLDLLRQSFEGELLHIELGKFYHREGQYELAIEELKKAIELNPNNELSRFEMGNVSVKVKDDLQAEKEYKKALELNGHFPDASLELGKIYRRQGRIKSAMEEFKKVIALFPENWDAHYEIGRIYRDWGNYALAAEEMNRALEINTDNDQIHFDLGKIYRDMGLVELSIKQFSKVLAINNNNNALFIKNKVLNEIEITEKKLILESKVRAVVAMIINACNVRCVMCNIWKSPWQASQKTLDELVNLFPYIEDMVWEGGEVFLMKGFKDILQETTRYPHLKQVIFTNGLLINEKILDRLMDIRGNVDIVFSIDAVTKKTYEHIRKGGRFERLIRNLTLFNEIKRKRHPNINIYFNAVIMKSNYREMERFIDFAKEYGFNAMTLTPIRGDFGQENIFDEHNSEALEYIRGVMPGIIRKAYEYGIRLHNWIPGAHGGDCGSDEIHHEGYSELEGHKRTICHAPWQRMVIDSEGQVRPFVFCLNKWIGNTDKNSLEEIWNSEAMQGYRRKIADHDYMGLCQPECISGQVGDKIRDIV